MRRCLKKDPNARWQSMTRHRSDPEVDCVWRRSAGQRRDGRASRAADRAAAALVAAVAVLGLVFVLVRQARLTPANEPVVALSVSPPPGGAFTTTEGSTYSAQLAMSPDGRSLAFVASDADGTSHIWIRELGSVVPRRVGSTANATYPFWSPDSRSLGFFAGTTLRRVELDGSPSREVAPASIGRGGTWGPDDTILFGDESDGPLWRVKADSTRSRPADQLLTRPRRQVAPLASSFSPMAVIFCSLSGVPTKTRKGVYSRRTRFQRRHVPC